jgi:hypothetical protein
VAEPADGPFGGMDGGGMDGGGTAGVGMEGVGMEGVGMEGGGSSVAACGAAGGVYGRSGTFGRVRCPLAAMAISSSSADSGALCCTARRSMVPLSVDDEVPADEDVDGDDDVDDAGTVP